MIKYFKSRKVYIYIRGQTYYNIIARKDKKSRKYIYGEKTFTSPQKLRQHYKSNKNQCTSRPPSRNISKPQSSNPIPEPATIPQVIDQVDPEAGPSPSTQAYREEH